MLVYFPEQRREKRILALTKKKPRLPWQLISFVSSGKYISSNPHPVKKEILKRW
jgi:hypothetical protein